MKFLSRVICRFAFVTSLVLVSFVVNADTSNLTIDTFVQIEKESLEAHAASMANSLAVLRGESVQPLPSDYVSNVYTSHGMTIIEFFRFRQNNLEAISAWYDAHPNKKQERADLENQCAALQQAIEVEESN